MKRLLALPLLFASVPAFAAVISIASLIDVLIWLLIAGAVYWLGLWLIGQIGPCSSSF